MNDNPRRFERVDLNTALKKLIDGMYITINGCLVEKLPSGQYKWGDHVGTLPEVAAKIREAAVAAKQSIERGKQSLTPLPSEIEGGGEK